ncbi:MAG: hypothetical protein GY830_03715 [Bacteroidetes bacterium]|nr:hypothetical protein [Bacteroidota bacterium]
MAYTIVIPKDKKIEKKLDFNQASEAELITFLLLEKDFFLLLENKIFDLINSNASIMIDYSESEAIKDSITIKKVVQALQKEDCSYNKDLEDLVKKIINLMEEAIKREVGIYFSF